MDIRVLLIGKDKDKSYRYVLFLIINVVYKLDSIIYR